MRSYTVHHTSPGRADILARAEDVVFVKQGFCWPALFVPGLWLIYRGLWLSLLGYIAASYVASIATGALTDSQFVGNMAMVAVNLMIALIGNDLRRWKLERRGLTVVAAASGRDLDDAELRFFERLIGDDDALPAARPAGPRPNESRRSGKFGSDQVLGLFPAAKPTGGNAS